jgi:hypothetical protein
MGGPMGSNERRQARARSTRHKPQSEKVRFGEEAVAVPQTSREAVQQGGLQSRTPAHGVPSGCRRGWPSDRNTWPDTSARMQPCRHRSRGRCRACRALTIQSYASHQRASPRGHDERRGRDAQIQDRQSARAHAPPCQLLLWRPQAPTQERRRLVRAGLDAPMPRVPPRAIGHRMANQPLRSSDNPESQRAQRSVAAAVGPPGPKKASSLAGAQEQPLAGEYQYQADD